MICLMKYFLENRNDDDSIGNKMILRDHELLLKNHIRTIENNFSMVRNFIQQQKLKKTGATTT